MRVLVTGGLGFIGSHQVALLLEEGFEVAALDNLSNCHESVAIRLKTFGDIEPAVYIEDVTNFQRLSDVVGRVAPDAVIHFAGKKHVGESVQMPTEYYHANVGGLMSLISACTQHGVKRVVFSSSGSIYGETDQHPIVETHPHAPTNPYSMTKSVCERILRDVCAAHPAMSAIALRYFNPAGAHPSGVLGEWCLGPPSNLLPRLVEAAYGESPVATIHGDDYNTPDGTGVRDYIHVMDVVEAHLRALEQITAPDNQAGFNVYNVGRGEGVSVRQLIDAVERASGKKFDVQVGPRRSGDVSALYGDTTQAAKELGMVKYRPLQQICEDAWRFRVENPNGYS